MQPTMLLSVALICFSWISVATPLEDRAVDPAADPTRASVLSVLATAIPASATSVPTLAPGEKPPAWYEKLPADAKSLLPALYPKSQGDVHATGTLLSSSEDCTSTTTITKTLTQTAAPEESTECTTTTSTTTLTLTFTVHPSSSGAPVHVTPSSSPEASEPGAIATHSHTAPVPSILPSIPPYANLSATAAPTSAISGSQAPSATSGTPPAFTGGVGRVVADFMVMGVLGAGGIWFGLN